MASTEGAPIPRAYGRVRLSGQLIWATQLEEVVSRTKAVDSGRQGRPDARRRPRPTATSAISPSGCARDRSARVAHLGRRQATRSHRHRDAHLRGDEAQAADALIVAKEGAERAGLSRPRLCGVRAPAARQFRQPYPATVVRGGAPDRPARADGARGHIDPRHDRIRLRAGDGGAHARARTVGAGEPARVLRRLRCVGVARRIAGAVPLWNALRWRRPGSAQTCAPTSAPLQPGVDSAVKETLGATWSVAGLDRETAPLVSTDRRTPGISAAHRRIKASAI